MSVRLDEGGTIRLEGNCPVEEAESLLALLQAHPNAAVDWSECQRLHTSLVQVLLAASPEIQGTCADSFISQWVALKSVRMPDS